MVYVFCGFIAALVAVYMARPRFTPRILSSAMFFNDEPPASATSWKVSLPRFSRSFFAQLAVLLLLLGAIIAYRFPLLAAGRPRVGLWIFLDRSAVITTEHS